MLGKALWPSGPFRPLLQLDPAVPADSSNAEFVFQVLEVSIIVGEKELSLVSAFVVKGLGNHKWVMDPVRCLIS